MSETVNLPALGESVTEGTVTRWLKQVGDRVEVDEPLLEVSTDKVDTEIPSPVAGVIEEILVAEDETAEVGAALVRIGDGSGSGSAPAEAAPAAEAPAAPAEAPAAARRSARSTRRRSTRSSGRLPHRAPRSPCLPWASPSPKAPSPAGSRPLAKTLPLTSRCWRFPPTRSTPRSRPRSPAPCWKSAFRKTRPLRSAPSWPSSVPLARQLPQPGRGSPGSGCQPLPPQQLQHRRQLPQPQPGTGSSSRSRPGTGSSSSNGS